MRNPRSLIERCSHRFESRPVRGFVLTGLLAAKVIANANLIAPSVDTPELRGVLPDPIDVINHSGNVTSSVIAALAIGLVARRTAEAPLFRDRLESCKGRLAVAAGTIAAVGANAVIESVDTFTSDPYDFACGVGAGLIAATMLTPDRDETPAA